MGVRTRDLVAFLDSTLEVEQFRDYGPNGLQIEASEEVSSVVTGVSASLELFEAAKEHHADLVVVHHGLMWGAGLPRITGPVARRIAFLFNHQISLAAYHLPLDKHARLGNNVGLCDVIGLAAERDSFGDIRGHALGMSGRWSEPVSRAEAIERVRLGVCGAGAAPFVFPYGPQQVGKVGVCTGAASDLLEAAAEHGCDLFVTGELAERAEAVAKELGITLVAAGHYRTEVFGPQRLADEISRNFTGLNVQFAPVPSPV